MGKKEKTRFLIVWLIITLVFLVGSFVVPSPEKDRDSQGNDARRRSP